MHIQTQRNDKIIYLTINKLQIYENYKIYIIMVNCPKTIQKHINCILIIKQMGKCQSQPTEIQPQIPNPPQQQKKISSFISRHKNHPNQDFALPVQQIPALTKQVQQTLKKLGPFLYEKCGKYSEGTQLGPYKLRNGSIYVGQWHNGRTHGKGRYYLPDHSFFQGISRQNQIEGYGRIIHENGDYFEGQLKQGKANGQGIYVQDDITYTGNFKDNLQHGQGTQSSPLYEFKGNFHEGSKQKGTLILKNKDKYEYVGEFKNNRYHGYGILTNEVGKYQGQFINGMKNGFGRFTWSDNSYYQGEYKTDQKHGQGKLCDKNNKIIREGIWQHNQIINS